MSIIRETFTVMIDKLLILGLRMETVGGKDRFAVLSSELSRKRARCTAMPNRNRSLKRPRLCRYIIQRRTIFTFPGYILLGPQPFKERISLSQRFPLLFLGYAKQRI